MKPIDFRIFRTNWIPDFLPIGSLWLGTSATALCGPYVNLGGFFPVEFDLSDLVTEVRNKIKESEEQLSQTIEEIYQGIDSAMPSKLDRLKCLTSFSTDVFVGETNLRGMRFPTGGRSPCSRFVRSAPSLDPLTIQILGYLDCGADLMGGLDHPFVALATSSSLFFSAFGGFVAAARSFSGHASEVFYAWVRGVKKRSMRKMLKLLRDIYFCLFQRDVVQWHLLRFWE